MSLPKSIYGSILVTVMVLALALIAGNATGNVQAAPVRAVETAVLQQPASVIGQITGTAQPGDTVRVTQGETLIGETVAEEDGAWIVLIRQSAAPAMPFHVQITPAAQRGAQPDPDPDAPITIWVSVVIGSNKVEVRVQVISPNGQVDIEVLAPLDPCNCEAEGASVQAQSTPEPTYHRVSAGETLANIAHRYGVTTTALMQANKLRNPNLIFVGQRLVIPR